MAERRAYLLARQDRLRQAVVCEPRGHDAIVGALLTPPVEPGSAAGVVFFNNAGGLGMCGHGLIGVGAHARAPRPARPGRAPHRHAGRHAWAPCSRRTARSRSRTSRPTATRGTSRWTVPGLGRVTGDVAWGGNWFFLTELRAPTLELANVAALIDATSRILDALRAQGVTGRDGALIDHVEIFGPPRRADADSRNFVLCPGLAYDRSPCGTGTSAKLAVLAARGKLAPGERWRQESITGSLFEGWLEERERRARPAHPRPRLRHRARDALLRPARPVPRGVHGRPLRTLRSP